MNQETAIGLAVFVIVLLPAFLILLLAAIDSGEDIYPCPECGLNLYSPMGVDTHREIKHGVPHEPYWKRESEQVGPWAKVKKEKTA